MESLLFAHLHTVYKLTGFWLSLRVTRGSSGLHVPWTKLTLSATLEEERRYHVCVQVLKRGVV